MQSIDELFGHAQPAQVCVQAVVYHESKGFVRCVAGQELCIGFGAIFHDKDLAFVTENEDGVVTVYSIGDKPTNDYTIQVSITEVNT